MRQPFPFALEIWKTLDRLRIFDRHVCLGGRMRPNQDVEVWKGVVASDKCPRLVALKDVKQCAEPTSYSRQLHRVPLGDKV